MKLKHFWPAVAMAIVLVGCNSKEKVMLEDKIEISIFQFKVENKEPLEELLAIYEKEHPNVKVIMQTVGGGDDYGAALRSKMASGNEPLIYNIGGPQDTLTWLDKLVDVSQSDLAQMALPNMLAPVTLQGKTYGLPMTQEGYGLLFNKRIFEKAGIDWAAIDSWDKLVSAVETLDSKKAELGLEAVFALSAKETWTTGLHDSNIALSQEFNGDVFKALNAKTLDFKTNNAFKAWMDLQNKYSVQPVNSLDYSMQVERLFGTGKVAIIKQGIWVYDAIASTNPEIAFNTGFLPVSMPGLEQDKIMVGIPMFWTVNSSFPKKQQQAALDLLLWIYSSETGKDYVVNRFNFISPYEGYETHNSNSSNPLIRDIARYSQEGKTMGWVFMGYPESWGMESLGVNLQRYFDGKATWNEVVAGSKTDWTKMRAG